GRATGARTGPGGRAVPRPGRGRPGGTGRPASRPGRDRAGGRSVRLPPRRAGAVPGSDLDAALDRADDLLDRLVDRHPVLLLAVAVAERHGTGRDVLVPGEQHVRDLGLLRVADLLLHPVVRGVHLDPDAPLAQA